MPDPSMIIPPYDPLAEYEWDGNDIFTMTGNQFASLYHMMMREMNQSGGAEMALKVESYNAVWDRYMDGIRTGKIWIKKQPVPETLKSSDDSIVKNLF